ncbi:hypothetical protein [Nocardioides sp. InS609-2]|uniref:hypothetical protein n=1 Tax=Nocardioides sp. InS609-2 TaxID=2760705 RepID=UPI0020BEA98F|nr:hypothetical protein [Nocardioides sp. InS609-2]
MTERDAGARRPEAADLLAAEEWFADNGLPYFVDKVREEVASRLTRSRLILVGAAGLVVSVGSGILAGQLSHDVSYGISTGAQVLLVLALAYGLLALRGGPIALWAGRRTFRSLGMLFQLATRALPLLLLFVTFLFINTEVWMVAETLDGGVMGLTVLLFGAVATIFLLVRLPEEVGRIDDRLDGERVGSACTGTPLEPWTDLDDGPGIDEPMVRLERGNLVLVLLVSQVIQVLLLSLTVFGFFLVFGAVIMDPEVIQSWVGDPPTPFLGQLLIPRELVQVATFLSAFSGLYFTVYAVTDETYRKQFFTGIVDELERAVGAREVCRAMQRAQ